MDFSDIFLPGAITLASATGLLIVLGLALSDFEKAAALTSIFLVFFFFYGYLHESITYLIPAPHHYFLPLWVLFFFLIYLGVVKWRKSLHVFTKFLNLVSVTLVFLVLFNIGMRGVSESRAPEIDQELRRENLLDSKGINFPDNPRDIYYIVLDGYASSSTLKEVYGFDNREFTDFLEDKGFYLASGSSSNYTQTSLSLSSSLNMDYLDRIREEMGSESSDQPLSPDLMDESLVASLLQEVGYTFVHFNTWWWGTETSERADQTFCGDAIVSEFRMRLIETTVISPFHQRLPFIPGAREQREEVLCVFSELAGLPEIDEPTFTLAHVMPPHPPYLFDEEGGEAPTADLQMTKGWNRKEDYLAQVRFVNDKLEELLEKLLTRSSREPIIILQADHGPASTIEISDSKGWEDPTEEMINERMSILNSYYFPDGESEELYRSISPVNTFRLIFNSYFDQDYELLEDKHYFSPYNNPYEFEDVTSQLEENTS